MTYPMPIGRYRPWVKQTARETVMELLRRYREDSQTGYFIERGL